jgi:pyridoxal/pyridoxine/pyridoxamine kinase
MSTVLDPVMGDNGKLYVDASVPPVYQSLMAQADLIVPNQFELEYAYLSPLNHFPVYQLMLHLRVSLSLRIIMAGPVIPAYYFQTSHL